MRKWILFPATLALLVMASQAQATLLPPGGFVLPVPTASYAGTVLASITQGYSFSTSIGTATGTVTELVVRDTLNPFGAGDLSFIYQVKVSTIDVGAISGGSYTGFLTDVAQTAGPPSLPAGTVLSLLATRSTPDTVRFTFFPSVLPGETSFAQIIRTNATAFTTGTIGLIDSGGETLNGFAPTATPEPTSLVLLASLSLGIGCAAFRRHRRRPEIA
jgi:hypothetical protein